MRVRYRPAESGTCCADLCSNIVAAARVPSEHGDVTVRAFCPEHAEERDAELFVRNASGGTAEVVLLSDWERDPDDGRVRRKSNGDASGIVD